MYDLLCALCSAPFTTPEYTGPQVFDYSDTALSLGEGYERWLSLSANQWLEHLRAVGVNSARIGAKRCYISGIGTNTYSSSICVEPGDHPNAPTTVGGSNDLVDLDAYCCWKSTRNGMGVFPVHVNCLSILKMVFQQEGLDLDADILYESFRNTLLTHSFANQFGYSGFDFDIINDSSDMVTFVPQSEESEEEVSAASCRSKSRVLSIFLPVFRKRPCGHSRTEGVPEEPANNQGPWFRTFSTRRARLSSPRSLR